MKRQLMVDLLKEEAQLFAERESSHKEKVLYGVTDGKAVGTYLEHKFQERLQKKYHYKRGSSTKGIDFPQLGIDIKVTSIRQPQSSCPFESARQKIYGLGYSLIIFVYDKKDNTKTRTTTLNIKHVIFVESGRTGDYQTTREILKILDNNGNVDDLVSLMTERFMPVDEIQAQKLAEEILNQRPQTGYLTISNALQWRLQYSRVIEQAGNVDGVLRWV
jgi:hypothetical protein